MTDPEPRVNDGFTFYFASWYKKSPYFARTVEAGCTSWDLYNHMLIPTLYDDDVAEYWHLLEHVTLWDVAVERQVEIAGPDAARFTQLLTPRDLSACEVGQCKYVVLCAPDGGIVNDPILLRLGEDRFWLSLADSDALLYALGVQAFAGLDVEIREPDVSPLQVQGPKSKPLIRKLFGDAIADLRYYRCAEAELDGIPLVVSRTGWSGEVGYELYLGDAARGTELWDRVMSEVGDELPPSVEPTDDDLPVSAMSYTVEEHYRDSEDSIPIRDKRVFDGDLRNLFASSTESPNGQPAADFITSHRREMVGRISYWTGESSYVVRQFMDFLRERVEALELRVRGLEASTLIELTAFGTAVIMNFRHTNVIDGSEADEE